MAATSGAANPDLKGEKYLAAVESALRTEPWTFDFFQAVRMLQRLFPLRAPIGKFSHPSREVVRLAAHTSTAFPASQIQGLTWSAHGPDVMVVNFMGLTGPSGVLPLYYSELVQERLRAKDRTLLAFLNIFNHRMISLFYQAWEKYRFTVAYERKERDRLSQHLLDLIGLGTPGLQSRLRAPLDAWMQSAQHSRQSVPDDSLLFYSGLFSLHTRSASALRQILIDFFEVPVEIEQFVGGWYSLTPENQCAFRDTGTFSEQLGVGAVVGDEIWDQQSGVRIQLGPLTLNQYVQFLPGGSAYQPLRVLTRFFAGDEIDFELQLILKSREVPACELDDRPDEREPRAPQLGWSTWVKSVPMRRNPADTILRISTFDV